MSTPEDAISYERDIKPLFTERDHGSMTFKFDLWSYDDVKAHHRGILSQLQQGKMPCYGAWPADRVALFERWTETGMAP